MELLLASSRTARHLLPVLSLLTFINRAFLWNWVEHVTIILHMWHVRTNKDVNCCCFSGNIANDSGISRLYIIFGFFRVRKCAYNQITFLFIFSVHKSFASLVKFIAKCFILFDAFVSGIVFFFNVLYRLFMLMYSNVAGFCVLTLYPANLLNAFLVLTFLWNLQCF